LLHPLLLQLRYGRQIVNGGRVCELVPVRERNFN
jgi:hypothetical protein